MSINLINPHIKFPPAPAGADAYQLEDGSGNYQLEDGTGNYLLE